MQATLYYVHDPMCSWCWGFEPARRALFADLDGKILSKRLLGGLAPDSDAPMAEAMQIGLQQTWKRIQQVIPNTRFNFDFWADCKPRRSTYPACRAILAAQLQSPEFDLRMTRRIQQAYYLEARNPSDVETLVELAADIGLEGDQFASDMAAPATQQQLLAEIERARAMGINGFPSLAVVDAEGQLSHVGLHYTDVDAMRVQIEGLIG